MAKKIKIDPLDISNEIERCRTKRDEYEKVGDNEMALAYSCRIDALTWVIRIGE